MSTFYVFVFSDSCMTVRATGFQEIVVVEVLTFARNAFAKYIFLFAKREVNLKKLEKTENLLYYCVRETCSDPQDVACSLFEYIHWA